MRHSRRIPILDRPKAYQGTCSIDDPLIHCCLYITIIEFFDSVIGATAGRAVISSVAKGCFLELASMIVAVILVVAGNERYEGEQKDDLKL